MKKLFVLCTMLLWVAINALAQQKISVSGIVTDENKEPVIGANVSVKDVPGLGTITDLNGRYVIKVEPYNRLVFSYIGYQSQEVLIKNQSKVNIVLKEDVTNAIDEVVITGTGAQTKLTQTGAITTVSVKVTDETEINSVRISYRRPKTNNNTLVLLDYNATTGYYDGDIKIEENSEDGLWKIDYIYVSDKFYNSRQINNTNVSSYGENADLSIADFEVTGTF